MRVLVIDHRDSFTFNLVAYLEEILGHRPEVRSFDSGITPSDTAHFDAIVLSPGPGRVDNPTDIGATLDIIRTSKVPMLGVCLGHQAMAYAWGGGTTLAEKPVHGETTLITHDGTKLFTDLPSPLEVVRYHSLIADPIPADLKVTARTAAGTVMAIEHRNKPQWGVQFHPESVGGFNGRQLLHNFLLLAKEHNQRNQFTVHSRTIQHVTDTAATFAHLFADSSQSFFLDATDRQHTDGAISYLGDTSGPYARSLRLSLADGPVFDHIDAALAHTHADCSAVTHLNLGFNLGWVGYLGYELKAECGGNHAHQSPYPDAYLLFIDRMIAVDHTTNSTHLLWLETPDEQANYQQHQWLNQVENQLQNPQPLTPKIGTIGKLQAKTKAEYLAAITICAQHIIAGDSYEVCLTNQLRAPGTVDSFPTYLALRNDNPAPFGAYLNFGEVAVLSSSPERFLKVDAYKVVESRPIKGTRPRGTTPEEDEKLRADLATNPKDRAENLMIVDLVRNDLARVAQPGSVEANPLFAVESFATVHQLVSTVRAKLRPDCSVIDLIKVAFPGGSMTGAPKVRTMEIIDAVEGEARGIYSGALGYFGVDGAMDLSMVIRTIIVDETGISYGVGGAILALSDHEEEYREIITKSRPLLQLFGQDYPK